MGACFGLLRRLPDYFSLLLQQRKLGSLNQYLSPPTGMRVPASVLQQALEFSSAPGEDSGADLQTAWLKSVFGVDAVAEQFAGKSRWTGEALLSWRW